MSASKTTIEDELVANVHPGEILREDFMIGSQIPVDEVALGTGLQADVIQSLLDESRSVDAPIDLRLGRYFGMTEGFFLRLQNSFDLEEERRAHGEELSRIVRRAA